MEVGHIIEITVHSNKENQQLQLLLKEHRIPHNWQPSTNGRWTPYPIIYALQEGEFKKIEEAEILQH